MIVANLRQKLPRRYFTEPRVHSEASAEVGVADFENEAEEGLTTVWAPSRPTLALVTDLPAQDVYEVRVYDEKRQCRLVAAVEIISPANLDRPEHRRAFVAKCAGLLRDRVSVVLVDMVTTHTQNLYVELLDLIGQSDPGMNPEPSLYAASCRLTKHEKDWMLETWAQPLELGRPLPTLPLWLADNLAVPSSWKRAMNRVAVSLIYLERGLGIAGHLEYKRRRNRIE